jgi:hypothetical protein
LLLQQRAEWEEPEAFQGEKGNSGRLMHATLASASPRTLHESVPAISFPRDEETHWGHIGRGRWGWMGLVRWDDFLYEHTHRRRKENPSKKQGPHNFNEKLQVVERV